MDIEPLTYYYYIILVSYRCFCMKARQLLHWLRRIQAKPWRHWLSSQLLRLAARGSPTFRRARRCTAPTLLRQGEVAGEYDPTVLTSDSIDSKPPLERVPDQLFPLHCGLCSIQWLSR
jgi:hypothetical protein